METVLITGAGRGIGLKLAEEFLRRDYQVIGTVRSSPAKEAVEGLAAGLGKNVEVHFLEVTDSQSVDDLKKILAGRPLDILINNAGVLGGDKQEYDNLDFGEWQNTLEVNTIAPMRLALAFLPNLLGRTAGKIVTISSILGSLTDGGYDGHDAIAYRSSKAAVNKAMQCLALELRPKNVGVYLMHPGWVRTDMGGADADIDVAESCNGLADTIINFTLEDSAKFWNYDGAELAW